MDLPEMLAKVEMIPELRVLFKASDKLNKFASQNEKYNFQSILLALDICHDTTSLWFQNYVEGGEQFQSLFAYFAPTISLKEFKEITLDATEEYL